MSGELAATTPDQRARWTATGRPGRAITAGVVAAAVLVGAICLALVLAGPDSENADGHWFVELAANLFTVGVGLVMWHARPGNRAGPLVIVMGFAGSAPFLSWANGNGVAWTIGDDKNTVMDTGLYNLTEQESTVLVHYGTAKTAQWMMVRLKQQEQPGAKSQPSGTGS